MDKIRDTYTWLKWLHKKGRWGTKHPTILAVRGAELVRGRPSEVTKPPPPPAPKTVEQMEKSANAQTPDVA